MSIAQAMLGEFEHEAKTTRKFLEHIPQDKLRWKPHEKSHTIGELGLHIANVPGFLVQFALVDSSPIPTESEVYKQPASVQDILSSLEKSIEKVREVLPTLDDARLMSDWSGMVEGKPVITVPKAMVLRVFMMNHWIHHRGQLGVFLRLVGAKVPGSYGPSGDEG